MWKLVQYTCFLLWHHLIFFCTIDTMMLVFYPKSSSNWHYHAVIAKCSESVLAKICDQWATRCSGIKLVVTQAQLPHGADTLDHIAADKILWECLLYKTTTHWYNSKINYSYRGLSKLNSLLYKTQLVKRVIGDTKSSCLCISILYSIIVVVDCALQPVSRSFNRTAETYKWGVPYTLQIICT